MTLYVLNIIGIFTIFIVLGMAFYPLLQAFGIVACECEKNHENDWQVGNRSLPSDLKS